MAKMKMGMGKAATTKPHIRMRKLKPVAASAFPAAPMAFPPSPPQGADPAAAMGGPAGPMPGGMSTGAGPGDMGT
jgi:hypothetical protein